MRIRFAAALILLGSFPLFAALSDAAALNKARQLWGPLATISSIRNATASNWTKLVGIETKGCADAFTIIGTGFNTWDAAFDNAALYQPGIAGPFNGTITLQMYAWDMVGIARFNFIVDGIHLPDISQPAAPQMVATKTFDTTTLTTGVHVLCGEAHDSWANRTRSPAYLFRVDQRIISSSAAWLTDMSSANKRPAVSIHQN